MMELIWLLPILPLAGFVLLLVLPLFGVKSTNIATAVGVGSVASAALLTAFILIEFLLGEQDLFRYTLSTWIASASLEINFAYYLDGLSLVMICVITGVGFLIHCFSVGYMAGDPGYFRYFAYLNLFIAAMLVLVLADNYLLLYLGWEGVGLCSFLLIGFWYQKAENGLAARKAFIVTRAGDVAMALGLFLLFSELGSLDIQQSVSLAQQQWPEDSSVVTWATLLLLGGAVGKSAQIPLQTWLPDAMAGPTPVSALIHAATMVTAGVYLIARCHGLFQLAPFSMFMVAGLGAFTLLLAGCSALVQTDIKRVLAYSTISQIGYMFFALGVGAWSAAIFHLVTHAFFKALLFLAAGQVILSVKHQQDMYLMGGLRKPLPIAFASFVIGCACLASLPLTSGFFSKEAILIQAWQLQGMTWFWILAVLGAFITAIYSFRLLFLVFFGEQKTQPKPNHSRWMGAPLMVLCLLALLGGGLNLSLESVFPKADLSKPLDNLPWLLAALPLLGVAIAYLLYGRSGIERPDTPSFLVLLRQCWLQGWWFDLLYHWLFTKPFTALASINRKDVVDLIYTAVIHISNQLHLSLSYSQNGQLRWYATLMAVAMLLLLSFISLEVMP